MGTNEFPKEFRYLFEDSWRCWICGMNTATALHHVVGRGNSSSNIESSILNAAWLCNYKCHINIHGKLRSRENMSMLLKKTRLFLESQHYTLNKIDDDFINKYQHLYGDM